MGPQVGIKSLVLHLKQGNADLNISFDADIFS